MGTRFCYRNGHSMLSGSDKTRSAYGNVDMINLGENVKSQINLM